MSVTPNCGKEEGEVHGLVALNLRVYIRHYSQDRTNTGCSCSLVCAKVLLESLRKVEKEKASARRCAFLDVRVWMRVHKDVMVLVSGE